MIRVLIVDDSAVIRRALSEELSQYEDIEVVGVAMDPYIARDKILKLKPDVITLDLNMPKMDGLSFLAKLMKYYPLPVVIVSSVTVERRDTVITALELGALDIISKPGPGESVSEMSIKLLHAIRAASVAKVTRVKEIEVPSRQKSIPVAPPFPGAGKDFGPSSQIIAIGASTGGTKALEDLLIGFPESMPGTVVVQHMPAGFTASFANRLDTICQVRVREASDSEEVKNGVVLIAPGNKHMLLQNNGRGSYCVRIKDGPAVHYQRPSVDVLFDSVANSAASNAIGVIMTGMGSDGATGLLAMRQNGAYTFAQDESTSVVFGMPKEAIKLGAVNKVVPLPMMTREIINAVRDRQDKRK